MSFRINTRKVGEVMVIDCAGRITLSYGTSALRDCVREQVNSGHKKILLNLGEVNYLDTSGIGELVSSFTTVTNPGGQLKLLSLNKPMQELFKLIKLDTIFDCHKDEAEAIRSFA